MIFKVENICVDKANENGRFYSKEILENDVINDDITKEKIANKSFFIELLHSDDALKDEYDVNLLYVCGAITHIFIKKNHLYIDVDFIKEMSRGKEALDNLKNLKVYMMGVGSLNLDKDIFKVVDFTLEKFYFEIE